MTIWVTTRTLVIGAILIAPITVAHATSVNFTDAIWDEGSGPAYAPTIMNSIGGIEVTATAGGPAGTAPKLYQDSKDGLGVRLNYETDEIEGSEFLAISFDQKIRLTEIGITDLFNEIGLKNNPFTEVGFYETVHGVVQFDAVQNTGTDLVLALSGLDLIIDSIKFYSPGIIEEKHQDHEYSLHHLEITAVPVPAAFWMFGTALIGFVAMSRRIKV
jgi:hypothetical protein